MFARFFPFATSTRSAHRKPARPHLALESLEDRLVLSVSAQEQEFVYLLNRARHDPAAYQREAGLSVDLSTVAPQPPLAINNLLEASSQFHANEMATFNYFNHQSQVTGEWPNKMARDQGYPLPSLFPNDQNEIESIAAGFSDAATALEQLIIDNGISPPGHRIHLLAMNSFFAQDREIGVGYRVNAASTYQEYWAIHTAYVNPTDRFLTGVAFNDTNHNGRYDVGEGIAGATITVAGMQTMTNEAGGWSIPVTASGTYHVTISGATFAGTASADVSVGDANVEVDFLSGQAAGVVNFAPTTPTVATASTASAGLSRVQVASSLTHSYEYYAQFVTAAYERYLKRDPDAVGLAGWAGAMQQGLTDEQLEAAFIGSPEYIAQHGGTGAAWVQGLYRDLLGRDPDALGLQNWLTGLQGGMSPSRIAYGFAASPEREAQRIGADYQKYLGRAPEAGSTQPWVDSFEHGASNEDVVASFVASDEYFQKHSGTASGWLNNLYQDVLSRAPDQAGYSGWMQAMAKN